MAQEHGGHESNEEESQEHNAENESADVNTGASNEESERQELHYGFKYSEEERHEIIKKLCEIGHEKYIQRCTEIEDRIKNLILEVTEQVAVRIKSEIESAIEDWRARGYPPVVLPDDDRVESANSEFIDLSYRLAYVEKCLRMTEDPEFGSWAESSQKIGVRDDDPISVDGLLEFVSLRFPLKGDRLGSDAYIQVPVEIWRIIFPKLSEDDRSMLDLIRLKQDLAKSVFANPDIYLQNP